MACHQLRILVQLCGDFASEYAEILLNVSVTGEKNWK